MFRKALDKVIPVWNWIRCHKYISVTIVFFVIIFVVDDNSIIKHVDNRLTISVLEEEIEQMKRDSAVIMQKQEQLDSKCDREVVEKLARDKYGMHKDNEEVFIIEE
jgi:cell division protein FtsB